MKTAVVVDSVRTGLAKSHRGGFNITRCLLYTSDAADEE